MHNNANEIDIKQTNLLSLLKEAKIDFFKSYRVDKLLFNVSHEALQSKTRCSYKKLLRILIFDSVLLDYNQIDFNLPLMVSYNYHREDHSLYWKKFKDIIEDYNEINVNAVNASFGRIRRAKEFFCITRYYRKIYNQIKNIKGSTVKRVVAAYLAELKMLEDKIKFLEINSRAAFIFFDGNHIENLIVQYLRNCGIRVATMQHGQPVFHGLDCDRINQTMILNFSSDYILVTGEFSKKQFMLGGVPEERIFVGGALRKINFIRESTGNNFAVFLDCPTNPNSIRDNKELLECAEKIGKLLDANYYIKCHPQDDPQNYKNYHDKRGSFVAKGTSIGEVLNEKAFGILHASGVYLDIVSEGVKAFCYVNDTDFPLVEEGLDSFATDSELIQKIKIWDSFDKDKKSEYMNEIINYYLCPNDVENRYINIVKMLNEKQTDGMKTNGEQIKIFN